MGKVIIVDGYSTGRFLPAEFAKHGWAIYHVQSAANPPELLASSFRKEDYTLCIDFNPDISLLAESLRELDPDALVVGAESGVTYGDELASLLSLPANVPSYRQARRDKFIMIEELRRRGLSQIKQLMTDSQSELIDWWNGIGQTNVVLKPLESAGSDGIKLCRNQKDLEFGFSSICGHTNLLGLKNTAVLAQEYLDGPQYAVNCISLSGRHCITAVWLYDFINKYDGKIIFDGMQLLSHRDRIVARLIDYANQVLDTIGVENGASHIEIRLVDRGLELIECNCRMMGGALDRASHRRVLGYDQPEVLALSFVDPDAFMNMADVPYSIRESLKFVPINVPKAGRIKRVDRLDEIRSMKSFATFERIPQAGDLISPIQDTVGRSGFVYFIHEEPEVVLSDTASLKSMVSDGSVFVVH